jgi:hypothetical protein
VGLLLVEETLVLMLKLVVVVDVVVVGRADVRENSETEGPTALMMRSVQRELKPGSAW